MREPVYIRWNWSNITHKEEDSGLKTLNEVKPLENINENYQDFLGIIYEEN